MRHVTGWYVMGYCGDGRYVSKAWYKTRAEAEAEVARIRMVGAWRGMPPIIEPSIERMF